MGAATLNMGIADVYSALEKGVIDAADASSYVMNSAAGYHEIAKYPIVDFHSLPVLSMSVSNRKWNCISAYGRALECDYHIIVLYPFDGVLAMVIG